MNLKPWIVKRSKYIVRDQWLSLRADTCETQDGILVDPYYVFEYPDWAHIIAVDSVNRIMITQQYRHGAGRICREIPCGIIEKNETPENAARRELEEETGCTATEFIKIGSLYANPASHTNMIHIFLSANALVTGKQNTDPSENITCGFETINHIFEMIDKGEFQQATQVASLLLAFRHMNFNGRQFIS